MRGRPDGCSKPGMVLGMMLGDGEAEDGARWSRWDWSSVEDGLMTVPSSLSRRTSRIRVCHEYPL